MSELVFGRDGPDVAWRPSPEFLNDSRAARFLARHNLGLDSMQARAVADPGWFWGAAIDDLGLYWRRPFDRVVDLGADGWRFPRWWLGADFNHASASLAAVAGA